MILLGAVAAFALQSTGIVNGDFSQGIAGWPKATECAALAPDETPDEIFNVLATQKEKIVAVVGHQPGLGRLLAACLPAQVRGGVNPEAFELKKMGAALISFPKVARAGAGALQWLVPPRILRATQ